MSLTYILISVISSIRLPVLYKHFEMCIDYQGLKRQQYKITCEYGYVCEQEKVLKKWQINSYRAYTVKWNCFLIV